MVIIDPILGELEGATLHWLMLRLIVPANAQHPQQRTMYDREEIKHYILAPFMGRLF